MGMNFNINRDKSIDVDKVFLVDKQFRPIGSSEIYPVSGMKVVTNLNNNWECNFTVYRENNGIENPLWDKIEYLSLVKIENKGIFELATPITDEAKTYKECSGVSICEAETSQTNMTLEINTEDDIARNSDTNPIDTYYAEFPTVFCRDITDISVFPNDAKFNKLSNDEKKEILRRSSLLHRVFSEMPEYLANINIKKIDSSLRNLEYIFSWSDTSVYDICQDIAEQMQCIFIFDKFSRTFEVRDLKEHCDIDDCRDIKDGTCPICQKNGTTQKIISFGEYSGVEISTSNLAETIELSGDKDAIKNYFKIEGADDVITNRLTNRMIGNGYIWKLGDLQKRQMSKELVAALNSREKMMKDNDYENKYNDLWDQWNKLENERLEYQSGMMPSPETADENATYVYNYLFGNGGKIDYAYATNRYQTAKQIADSVIKYAKLLISTNHTIEYIEDSLECKEETWNGHTGIVTSISFIPHIYLDGYYIDNNESKGYVDEYIGSVITLKVCKGYDISYSTGVHQGIYTTDYYDYLQRMLDTAMAKSDITDEVLTMEPKTSRDISPTATSYNGTTLKSTHYSKYCYNRLKSFCDAYMSCTSVIAGLNADIPSNTTKIDVLKYLKVDGSESNIQEDLLGKYDSYIERLSIRMSWLEEQITEIENTQKNLQEQIKNIRDICDMQNYITKYCEDNNISKNLWHELCSFKRQDIYRNDNFIGEGVDDATLMKNVENLLKRAEEEIEDACNIHYSVSATIDNLLTMLEFEPLWDKFQLGNYIYMIIDDIVHTMRLISITYDYDDISHCSIEFSEIVSKTSNEDKISDILSQASSLASNAKIITRQAEEGASAKSALDIIKNDALNIANSRIVTADDQSFIMDKYGITGKYIDPVSGETSNEQIRIINNLLCFTDDNWKHTRTALGKITYLNPQTREYETNYGLIADTIIGNLVMSEKLIVSNEKNTVCIDGDGITLDGGAITWNKNNLPTSALNGYDDFRENLNNMLGVTTITSDSVISPKIGGGYLYIKDIRTSGNTGISVEINPTGTNFSGHKADYVFNVAKNNNIIMGVTNNGDGYFNGEITASSGKIGGWNISEGYLSYGDINSNNYTKLNANGKSAAFVSKSDNTQITLTSGYLQFFYGGNQMAKLHSTYWVDTPDIRGVGLQSEYDSKFISFGNKKTASDENYATVFLLNYGLDPNGCTEGVIVYGKSRFNDEIHFANGYYLDAWNLIGEPVGIGCSGSFVVQDSIVIASEERDENGNKTVISDYKDYKLSVPGKGYIKEIKAGNIAHGVAEVVIKQPNTVATTQISLDMEKAPSVILTPHTSVPASVHLGVSSVSRSGFTIQAVRTDNFTGSMGVSWIAMC
ncbi:MAG: hypothetical protein J1E62_05450 [Lachnospiraceae bacterium]|nr:hypothetical protein [Lachnospiraceae bacterium]